MAALTPSIRATIAGAVGRGVDHGFAAVLATAVAIAALSVVARWLLVRPAEHRAPPT